MKSFGQIIRELRKAKELSLRELAKTIGVSAPFLSDVELGRRFPSEKVLSSLAQALNMPLEELRKHDPRFPVEELKRLALSNPLYSVAFRLVIDEHINPQDLISFIEKKTKRLKKP